MREQKLCTTEAFGLLETARTEFSLDALSAIKASLVEAQTLFNSGKQTEGKLAYRVAQTQLEHSQDLSPDDKLDVLVVRLSFDDEATAKSYSEEVLAQVRGNRRLENKFYSIIENSLAAKPEERLAMMKKRGEELVNRADWEDAADIFVRACGLKNADTDVRLGAIKAIVNLFISGRRDPDKVPVVDELITQLANLPNSDPRFPTLERLQKDWKEVTASEQPSDAG